MLICLLAEGRKWTVNSGATHPSTCQALRLRYLLLEVTTTFQKDFPGGSDGKSVCLQWGRPRFDPWVGKMPWRRKWQPTRLLLSGKSHGWRSLVGYSSWGRKELDTTERLHFGHHLSELRIQPHSSKQPVTPHRMETSPDRRRLPLSHLDPLMTQPGSVGNGIGSSRLLRASQHWEGVVPRAQMRIYAMLKEIKRRLTVAFEHFLVYQVLSSALEVHFLVHSVGHQHRASLTMFCQDELLSWQVIWPCRPCEVRALSPTFWREELEALRVRGFVFAPKLCN